MIQKLSSSLRQLTKKNVRFFDLHEYQSKEVMHKFNVKAQYGVLATSAEEAFTGAKKL